MKIEDLIEEYEKECVNFSEENCAKLLNLYMDRMEDCQLKALLYKYLEYKGDLL